MTNDTVNTNLTVTFDFSDPVLTLVDLTDRQNFADRCKNRGWSPVFDNNNDRLTITVPKHIWENILYYLDTKPAIYPSDIFSAFVRATRTYIDVADLDPVDAD